MSTDEPAIETEQVPVTAPRDRGAEIRWQATGLVEGRLAEQAPAAGREAARTDGR
jgi:hypothetical protein